MGSCIEAIFHKNLQPKKESLLNSTSPQQLKMIMGIQNSNRDEFYCVSNLPKIEQLLDVYYKKLSNSTVSDPMQKQLKNYVNSIEAYILEMKNIESITFKKFLKDKQQLLKFYEQKQIKPEKSFRKRPSSQSPIEIVPSISQSNTDVSYQDIVLLKFVIKQVIVKSGPKHFEVFIDESPLLTITQNKGKDQDKDKGHKNQSNRNTADHNSQKVKNQIKSAMTYQTQIRQSELSTFRVNEFINLVALKSSKIIIKIPELNVQASVLLSDLVYRGVCLMLTDLLPLKNVNDDNFVLGYVSVMGQAFLASNFEQDYQNIIKQHEVLGKQLRHCEEGNWGQLYQIRNSSISQKSLQRSQSNYSQYPQQSMQFQLKF